MLLMSLLEMKNEFNLNFDLNNTDTRFSQMQLSVLSSVILNKPIKNIQEKNNIYNLFKRYKFNKNTNFASINLDVAYTKVVQSDRELIAKAMSSLEGKYENVQVEEKPMLRGVVAILEYDYR